MNVLTLTTRLLPRPALFPLLLAAVAVPALAQTKSPTPAQVSGGSMSAVRGPQTADVDDPGREAHETEEETIAKCLTDLKQGDVAPRRRAILLLGKYSAPAAQQAVIACLADTDVFVRRSALVALSEQRSIPSQASKPIVHLLTDTSVHIRRIASSLLPEILLASRFGGIHLPPRAGGAPGLKMDNEVKGLLNRALGDEDLVVRKNVLSLYRYAADLFEDRVVIRCLTDSDREIRVFALRTLAAKAPQRPELFEQLVPTASDPEPIVREEAARVLGRLGAQSLPLLRQLAKDPVPAVRAEAVQRLAQMLDMDAFSDIQALLADSQVSTDERRALLRYLLPYGEDALPLLRHHAEQGPTPMRAEAVRMLGALGSNSPGPELFLRFANDPSTEVRAGAMSALRRAASKLNTQQLTSLATSRHADVRRAAMEMAARLPPAQASEMVLEFLLDEDINLRCAAVKFVCEKGIPDWQLFLSQSLEDPEPQIQQAAIDALLKRNDAHSQQILTAFVQEALTSDLPATRLAALRTYSRTRLPSQWPTAIIEPLLSDPEEAVRMEVVEVLRHSGAKGAAMLRVLAQDPSLHVKSRAAAMLGQLQDPAAFQLLSALIRDERLALDERAELIPYLSPCGPQAVPLLMELVESDSEQTRAAAVHALGLSGARSVPVSLYMQLLTDPSAHVQSAAAMAIRRQASRLTPGQVTALFECDHPDVRNTALLQATRMPVAQASQMVIDAFDHADPNLRSTAVRVACARSLPTWHMLARRALQDASVQVRRTAATALLSRRDALSRQLLSQFIEDAGDEELAALVRMQLARQQKKPVSSPKRVIRPRVTPRR